jgi:hypothetical protein
MCVHERDRLSLVAEAAPKGYTRTSTMPVQLGFPGEMPSSQEPYAAVRCAVPIISPGST